MKHILVSLTCTLACGGALAQATAPASPSSSTSTANPAPAGASATPQTTAAVQTSAMPQTTVAQNDAPLPSYKESIVVLGQPVPETLRETTRAGMVIDPQGNLLAVPQFTDLLRTDSSVDLEMRGGGGVQTDVSIRGASFEQTLVLLNGMRINDAETSHFNLDVPVPLAALGGLDVLHGAGSTLYGSDAIGGVVNVRTLEPTEDSLRLQAGVGSYGINTQSVLANAVGKRWSEVLAGGRDFSSGFIADRDYRSEEVSSESRLKTGLGATDVLLAGSDRGFGAYDFYGNYPSFEHTKGWYGILQQDLGSKMNAAVSYRRHTDVFILFRANPALYENQHIDESWQGVLRRNDQFGKSVRLFTGLEENTDAIQSNNLGHHGRNRGAGYAQVELRPGSRLTLQIGGREEVLSGGRTVFSPSVSGAYRLTDTVKLRGAVGYGFRLPTYTDLYYSSPGVLGNPNLRPESAWNYEGGLDWFAKPQLVFSVTGFTSPQKDTIDYVRPNSTASYVATNLTEFRYSGFESSMSWRPTSRQQIRASWTFITGAQNVLGTQQSEYVFNYPVHNASAEWLASWKHGLTMRTRLGVTQRFHRDAYPVLDVALMRNVGRIQPYVQMTNLTNTGYQEIQPIQMQGRAFTGGFTVLLSRNH